MSFKSSFGYCNLAVEIKECTMASWTNNNSTYYINPAYLTFVEKSGYGANLIQVSASSSCYIYVFIPGVIEYSDADKNYKRWKVTAYNNKFPDNGKFYIYIRLEKDGASALVVYDKILRGVHGGEIVEKTDEDGNVTKEEGEYDEDHVYYFIHIGEVSGTDGVNIREIAYDTGYLTSDKSQNDNGGLNEMWELDKLVTPWLIKAKQWLGDFTVKGFVKLVGGLKFSKGKEGDEKLVTDIKRSTDSDNEYLIDENGEALLDEEGNPVPDPDYVPVSDETVPSTEWVKYQSDKKYLKKYEPDETGHLIKFHDGIECGDYVEGALSVFGGSGTKFDKDGYGEMNGLRLREFLEVPELRFNRVDVVSGILWNSVAFGLIESVDTREQTCTLKLEDGERSGIHVDDICIGMFCNFGDGSVSDEKEDENGFPKIYGFSTCYFTPSAILEDSDGRFKFSYELQPGRTMHPCASMKFAVYGNFFDKSRQASAYSTRTYKRYLKNVETWKVDHDRNIYAQYGDLTGLTIGGYTMSGYGSYQDNVYITGGIFEFTAQQKEELKGQDAYSASLSSYVGVIRVDEEGNFVVGEHVQLNVVTGEDNVVTDGRNVVVSDLEYYLCTTVQAFRGQTELFYSESMEKDSFMVSISPVGCSAELVNGTVMVTGVDKDAEYSYVGIDVSCEGNATFHLVYEVKISRDGVGGFVSLVFVRTNKAPQTPEGGSYDNPFPDESLSGVKWYDGIPDGEEQVWMSRCRFFSDGNYPEDALWSEPAVLTDTADIEIIYSEMESPPAPEKKTDESSWVPSEGWMDDPTPESLWMATSIKKNGVWGDWDVLKIKGEKGDSRLALVCSSSTVTRNSLGSMDPSSVLVKAVKGSDPAEVHLYMFARKVEMTDSGEAYRYIRLSMEGYKSYGSQWSINVSGMGSSDYRSIVFVASEEPVPDASYPGEYAAEISVNFVRDGVDGSMPRNMGEYDDGVTYAYDDNYRDFVWSAKSGTPRVFMRKNKGYVKGVSPEADVNGLYWEEVSRQTMTAIDTALIDGAWIGGFQIRNLRMESQNEGDPKLVLDGNSGYFKCVDADIDGKLMARKIMNRTAYGSPTGQQVPLDGYTLAIGPGVFRLPTVPMGENMQIQAVHPSVLQTAGNTEVVSNFSATGQPLVVLNDEGAILPGYKITLQPDRMYTFYGVGQNAFFDNGSTSAGYWLVIAGDVSKSDGSSGVKVVVDDILSGSSGNPIANKAVYSEFQKVRNELELKIQSVTSSSEAVTPGVLYIITK